MKNRKSERKMIVWLLVVLSGLLCLRAVSSVFLYPLLLVSVAVFVFAPFNICLPALCFLMPFAYIIKLQPGQISLFTVLFLIYVARTLLKKDALKRIFLISLLFFAAYAFIFSGINKVILIATMVCGFAMVHDACGSDDYDYYEVLYAFCFGIILSSTLGLFKEQLPIIDWFVNEATHKVGHEEYVERFVGLNTNPNYYTMDVTVALSCLTVSMSTSRLQKSQLILFAVLSVFGLMAVSKSFLLVWVILLLILLFSGLRNGGTMFLKLLSVFAVTAVFIYFFARESIDTYIFRLTQDASNDLSGVTTGRLDIWISYIKEIIKSEKVLFFGAGIGETLKKGTHNTYLEALYGVGIAGTFLYLFVLKMSLTLDVFPKRIVYYIPVIIMLIRFMGIGVFVNDCIWYYMVIICLSLKNGATVEKNKQQRINQ